jgi:hypothetical protein
MGTRGIFRTGATLVTAAGLALVIAGCATSQTDAAGPATSSPTATPTPTKTATPTPEPAATCATVFTDAEYASLEGYELTETARLDATLQPLVDAGGINCNWVAPHTDVYALYAHWPSDQGKWEALRAELLSADYTEIADPIPGILQAPFDGVTQPGLTYRDGVVYWVSYPKLFSSVLALQ